MKPGPRHQRWPASTSLVSSRMGPPSTDATPTATIFTSPDPRRATAPGIVPAIDVQFDEADGGGAIGGDADQVGAAPPRGRPGCTQGCSSTARLRWSRRTEVAPPKPHRSRFRQRCAGSRTPVSPSPRFIVTLFAYQPDDRQPQELGPPGMCCRGGSSSVATAQQAQLEGTQLATREASLADRILRNSPPR
jgi:hypothetical protein